MKKVTVLLCGIMITAALCAGGKIKEEGNVMEANESNVEDSVEAEVISSEMESFASGIKTEDTEGSYDSEFILNNEIDERCPILYEAKRGNVSYGEFYHATYYSNTCKMERGYSILMPADYSTDKKYPVLYLLHGISDSVLKGLRFSVVFLEGEGAFCDWMVSFTSNKKMQLAEAEETRKESLRRIFGGYDIE